MKCSRSGVLAGGTRQSLQILARRKVLFPKYNIFGRQLAHLREFRDKIAISSTRSALC